MQSLTGASQAGEQQRGEWSRGASATVGNDVSCATPVALHKQSSERDRRKCGVHVSESFCSLQSRSRKYVVIYLTVQLWVTTTHHLRTTEDPF